ncbi:3-hydroxyacyl-ACP dehydratase FabZ [Dichelobacter nodosus]|nr:beta-hydroxyacyl-(acyl-carrier-protein) dehydratase FabZ [Dichelobacter nodosus VCS1703A]
MTDLMKNTPATIMGIEEIRRYLPHRYPFLLIDRIIALETQNYIHALKNVTANEPFFQGHFPNKAVMPGVLVVEAMAQAAGILGVKSAKAAAGLPDEPEEDGIYFFVGIDKARFRKTVVPGDQLILEVKLLRSRRGIWSFDARATVDDAVVCTAEIMCTSAGKGAA